MVGDAVLGAEPAPFPSPLPPASVGLGQSAACELFSGLAQTLCSDPVNFFSLSCYTTVQVGNTKAPSDSPQGTQARSLL